MELNEWKNKNQGIKRYAHFDYRVSIEDVWTYISNPDKVSKHGFYPFIYYEKEIIKYNSKEGIKPPKKRELCYAAHIDRCIFQYYSYKLNNLYNERVEIDGINNAAIAYRDNLKKNNIHFAKEAFDFIKKTKNCYIIIGDFTKFFDSLNHKYLKERLKDLLKSETLPKDYYNIFKNITKYSIWNLKDLLIINGLPNRRSGIKKINEKKLVISKEIFKKLKSSNSIKNKENFGIPQGSSISAVLSNIYMLNLDKIINDYIKEIKGLYMRYSDDFIIVIPANSDLKEEYFKNNFEFINKEIKKVPNLELQPEKTKIFRFYKSEVYSCNNDYFENVTNGKNIIDYLGFSFDGNVITIRDKTISKYYYRTYRKIKSIVKSKKYWSKPNTKNLYLKYSKFGAKNNKIQSGNFITYVQRAEKIFGENEAVNRVNKNHLQKIKKRLNEIS